MVLNSAWGVHGIDVHDGQELWRREDLIGTSRCNVASFESRIYLNDTEDNVICLNVKDGSTCWMNRSAGNTGFKGRLDVHNGYLWGNIVSEYSCRITKVNLFNGLVEWKYQSPNKSIRNGATFQNGFTIDKELNTVYSSDDYFAVGMRLPN